jgi:hypothetical protein
MAEVGSQAVRLWGKDRPSMTEIVHRLEQAVLLCRSRHAPLPVFGTQIGSSTDASASPPPYTSEEPYLVNNPAQLLDKLVGEGEGKERDLDQGATGTNIVHLGPFTSSQSHTLEVVLQEERNKAASPSHVENYPSDVDLQSYHSSGAHSLNGSHDGGHSKRTQTSLSWQGTPEDQDFRGSCSDRVDQSNMLGIGTMATRESYYSGQDYSAAASTFEIPLGPRSSGKAAEYPLLEQDTTSRPCLESNLRIVGPHQDVSTSLLPPSSREEQEPTQLAQIRTRREADYNEEENYMVGQPIEREEAQGGLLDGLPGTSTNILEDQEFLDDYTAEHIATASYAGFSDFSVLQDLDELMRALHSLQEKQGQQTLDAETLRGRAEIERHILTATGKQHSERYRAVVS